jgi:dTMP kinase
MDKTLTRENGPIRNFAVFEGLDGSGTTTQLQLLKKRFASGKAEEASCGAEDATLPALWTTAEPTRSASGRLLRRALGGELSFSRETLAYLFASDRAWHLFGEDGVVKHAAQGELVVSDRYVPSSLVYQGLECGLELPEKLNAAFPAPSIIFYFELSPEKAEERMKGRDKKEIYEYMDFQKRAAALYPLALDWGRARGSIVEIIDADNPIEAIAEQVFALLVSHRK